ncbi:MAG: helicase-exonuclease AddAB subunit AddA, partial [Clostridia bacterium]|nr:helicase-exonuclease AddAB subunit AddA [Clostridia bacterium]
NPHYQRQQMLLPQANISTIHGFCARLLREQAGRVDLPVGFRVAEEGETRLLAAQAMDEVLEEHYRRRDPAFLTLAFQLNSQRDDKGLREAVEKVCEFMQAQPFPAKWLQEQLDAYTEVCPLERTRWMRPILEETRLALESTVMLSRRAAAVAVGCVEPYATPLQQDLQSFERLLESLFTLPYDQLAARVQGLSLNRLPPVRAKDAAVEEAKEEIKTLRDKVKKRLERVKKLFAFDEDTCRADLAAMAPMAEAMGQLVTAYEARFTQLKREKKWLDYGDLEHQSLRLLLDEESGEPTPLAVGLSARFTEIMVDEYQDTNAAQDALFRALSRGGENLFMVGDVKQSIYGFRQAMPALFTRMREGCTPYDPAAPSYPAVVTLENNFRSRREVTDTVNFLFRQLMQQRLGGVAYDEREELVCTAAYDPAEGCETEWLLLDGARGDEDAPETAIAEAGAIARRIRRLMETMTVKEGDSCRPLAYGDICILLRNRKGMAAYAKELNRLGIPTGVGEGEGLLATPEVQTVLALLRVVDNPLREVELAAVMLSPLYGFTADECARVRLTGKGVPLYTALGQAASVADELGARCARLLADLARLRTLSVSLPADRLLERIYRDTAVGAVFAARTGGRQRVANLHQLDRVARQFEQGGFRGLSAFIRYIDRLEEQGKELPLGSTAHREGVQLMTVHGSKGLEFPVVFLARLSGPFSTEDSRQRLLLHDTAGIGLRLRDEESRVKHTTLPFMGVQSARLQESRAEELRVWYVALTRAREKLILLYSAKDLRKTLGRLEADLPEGQALSPASLLYAASPGEWMLAAALRHPDFGGLRQTPDRTISLPSEKSWRVEISTPTTAEEQMEEKRLAVVPADEALVARLQERLRYRYPYEALGGVPAKLAASQLSHEQMSREYIARSRPTFLEKEGMTAAQRGTALHTFMQFADYGKAAADTGAEAQRLVEAGFLTPRQGEVLPLGKLNGFFASDLYRRMAASADCRREYHFAVTVGAGSLTDLPADMAAEPIVVQGIADCVFLEEGRLILVDYKTDRVKTPEELAERYRSQMWFYRQALEPLLGYPVGQILLYSFHLEQTVEIPV